MGKVVVTEFVSVDGVMDSPGGEPGYKHAGWVIAYGMDPKQAKFKTDEILEAEVMLLGRVTYESFAGAWPSREDEVGFADKMNSMPKHVVSSTLAELEWENSQLLEGQDELVGAVKRLKDQIDGVILVAGSRTLVHALVELKLVDEYRLMVFPVVLGSGRRVFPDNAAETTPLKLVDVQTFDSGVAVHTYHPADEATAT